jgi:hypothetical protein
MRGRVTDQPGRSGMVTFDVKTGSLASACVRDRAAPGVSGPDILAPLIAGWTIRYAMSFIPPGENSSPLAHFTRVTELHLHKRAPGATPL